MTWARVDVFTVREALSLTAALQVSCEAAVSNTPDFPAIYVCTVGAYLLLSAEQNQKCRPASQPASQPASRITNHVLKINKSTNSSSCLVNSDFDDIWLTCATRLFLRSLLAR